MKHTIHVNNKNLAEHIIHLDQHLPINIKPLPHTIAYKIQDTPIITTTTQTLQKETITSLRQKSKQITTPTHLIIIKNGYDYNIKLQTGIIQENPQITIHHTTPENMIQTLHEILTQLTPQTEKPVTTNKHTLYHNNTPIKTYQNKEYLQHIQTILNTNPLLTLQEAEYQAQKQYYKHISYDKTNHLYKLTLNQKTTSTHKTNKRNTRKKHTNKQHRTRRRNTMPKTRHTTRTTTTNTMEQSPTPHDKRTYKIPNNKENNTQQPRHNHTPRKTKHRQNNNTKHTKTRQKPNTNKKHIHTTQKTRQKTNKILQNTRQNTSQIHQRQTRTTQLQQNNNTNIRTTIQERKRTIQKNVHQEIPDNRLLPKSNDKTIHKQHDKRSIPATQDKNILAPRHHVTPKHQNTKNNNTSKHQNNLTGLTQKNIKIFRAQQKLETVDK